MEFGRTLIFFLRRELVKGYKEGPLQWDSADKDWICERWPDDPPPQLGDCIEHFPSCGLATKTTGQLDAYGLVGAEGGIANVYVRPEVRKKGLGAYAVLYLATRLKDDRLVDKPFVHVPEANADAAAFFERLGFESLPGTGRRRLRMRRVVRARPVPVGRKRLRRPKTQD